MVRFYFFIISLFVSTISLAHDRNLLYEVDTDVVLGNKNAPITIIDYSSFSCPGCASFHNNVLPELEAKYINTGKAKLIFRSYPIREIDLKAGAITFCGGKEMFYTFVKVLFKTQKNWNSESSHPTETLEHIAKLGGLSGEEIQKCFNDQTLEDKIVSSRYEAQNKVGINATPTFIINGKVHEGSFDQKKFFAILDSELDSR